MEERDIPNVPTHDYGDEARIFGNMEIFKRYLFLKVFCIITIKGSSFGIHSKMSFKIIFNSLLTLIKFCTDIMSKKHQIEKTSVYKVRRTLFPSTFIIISGNERHILKPRKYLLPNILVRFPVSWVWTLDILNDRRSTLRSFETLFRICIFDHLSLHFIVFEKFLEAF